MRTLARIAALLYLTGRLPDESVFDRDKSGGLFEYETKLGGGDQLLFAVHGRMHVARI